MKDTIFIGIYVSQATNTVHVMNSSGSKLWHQTFSNSLDGSHEFVDRLLETVPHVQIAELCDGSAENEAALALAYVMFLESARMEKQMAEDLAACAPSEGADAADAAAEVCRRLAVAEERRRQASLEKAAAYRRSQGRDN